MQHCLNNLHSILFNGVQITASSTDLNGHPGTNWPDPHIHVGDPRVHVAVAKDAIAWIVEQLG